jgi:putative restriction endonuclease
MTRLTRQRLHQSAFRDIVITAYNRKCTICSLQHPELLDAAHIIPDSEEGGLPIVPNGLSMCKIHHAAYDQQILGISPDYRVHIRRDLLDEIDGPMLKHGFQELENNVILLPVRKKDMPDPDRLALRFESFRSA